jgi:hypothetical protein
MIPYVDEAISSTPQNQNTTWLKAVDGDQKKDMGLLFFCSLFVFLQVMNTMGFY